MTLDTQEQSDLSRTAAGKEGMSNGESSPEEHDKVDVCFYEDARPRSRLSTGGKHLRKSVSFSEYDSVYLIPKVKNETSERKRKSGYILDVKQTFVNLLDEKSLAEMDERSEVELTSVLGGQEVNDGCSPLSSETVEVVIPSTTAVEAFCEQKGTPPVGSISTKSSSSTDECVKNTITTLEKSVTVGSSRGVDDEETRRKRSVDESIRRGKRLKRFKREYQSTEIEKIDKRNSKLEQKQEELLANNIGSRTRAAIKDYIVGLSDKGSANRFSSMDLVPMFVAVKGTLSKRVLKKEHKVKSKMGLDLVGTHFLRNHNINCAINFYFDKDTKEIAENWMLKR